MKKMRSQAMEKYLLNLKNFRSNYIKEINPPTRTVNLDRILKIKTLKNQKDHPEKMTLIPILIKKILP